MKTNTLRRIKELESIIRTGLANMAHARAHGSSAEIIAIHVEDAEAMIAAAQVEFEAILNTAR